MPSANTLHYAIPLCFAPRMLRNGQHGWHFTCYRPLRYEAPVNLWHCVDCGSSVAGGLIASRRGMFEPPSPPAESLSPFLD
jgi:hypothetical protein